MVTKPAELAENHAALKALEFTTLLNSNDFMACIQCGMCSASCPLGYAIEFTPRKIIWYGRANKKDIILSNPSVWMCVSCYTCSKRCPKGIELTDRLWPSLRDKALQENIQPPPELQQAFQNIYLYGNVLGESPKKRLAWAKDLEKPILDLSKTPRPVDILWIVACYPSFYPRNQVVTRAFARILQALDVDFGVLGAKEKSLGDCDRLYGEEGLFEMLVENNIELLHQFKFRKILVIDPHSHRALQRFYPLYGATFQSEHYTSYLYERLDWLKPMLKNPVPVKVTYHDNCCIGRRCNCYEPPRALLRAIPGVEIVEMQRIHDYALCCGGGGGGMWLDQHITQSGGHRLSDERILEAADTGADILAVSCPYELSRFEDAAKVAGLENKIKVRDIIELLAESMGIAEGGKL